MNKSPCIDIICTLYDPLHEADVTMFVEIMKEKDLQLLLSRSLSKLQVLKNVS